MHAFPYRWTIDPARQDASALTDDAATTSVVRECIVESRPGFALQVAADFPVMPA